MPLIDTGLDLLNTPGEFEPLPAGWTPATIVGCEVKKKEGRDQDGNEYYPYVEWRFKCTTPEGRESEVYHITTLKPPKPGYPSGVKAILVAAQIPFTGTSFSTEEALGRQCLANLSIEAYEGKQRNKVGAVKKLEG